MADYGYSPLQHRINTEIPFGVRMFLPGSRGSGKSEIAHQRVLAKVQAFPGSDHIYVRHTHDDLQGLWKRCLVLAEIFFGRENVASVSKPPREIRIDQNGRVSTIEFVPYVGPEDESRARGRTTSTVVIDEAGNYPTADVLADWSATVRQSGFPADVLMTSNHGDGWLAEFDDPSVPDFQPFKDTTGQVWVRVRSTFRDNAAINQEDFFRSLQRKYKISPAEGRRWLTGASDGSDPEFFLRHVMDPRRSRVPRWDRPAGYGWTPPQLSTDHGGTAPSCSVLFQKVTQPTAIGPDDGIYIQGDVVIFDIADNSNPGNLLIAMTDTIEQFCDQYVHPMCDRYGVRPVGVLDDGCFANRGMGITEADAYAMAGVSLRPAQKGTRIPGLAKLRSMLFDAAPSGYRERPGLYWTPPAADPIERTFPLMKTHPRHPGDMVSHGVPDHCCDAVRMALTARTIKTKQQAWTL